MKEPNLPFLSLFFMLASLSMLLMFGLFGISAFLYLACGLFAGSVVALIGSTCPKD